MKGLHVRFEGLTASYPYPFIKSGTLISLPCPPFSSLFGMLSACAGHEVRPDAAWMIGFEFISRGKSVELERTQRLKTDDKGRLRPNPAAGLARREFHLYPQLDIYLNQVNLKLALERPAATPCLGRSQDIAWITMIQEIDLEQVREGAVGPTLVPYPGYEAAGMVLPPLVDYYLNDVQGYTRVPGHISRYQALPDLAVGPARSGGLVLRSTDTIRLYHPSDSQYPHHAVIMQDLQ
jgi:CRISPR-associated protein Cas5t